MFIEWQRLFFLNDTATTEIYSLSLHAALPICSRRGREEAIPRARESRRVRPRLRQPRRPVRDRKSTRLNSSHANISYAVFCLKKTKQPATSPTVLLLVGKQADVILCECQRWQR